MVRLFNSINYIRKFPKVQLFKFLKHNLCNLSEKKCVKPKEIDYLLIIDFEATCDRKKILQEIIEFPCLKINLHTLQEEARFHHYVRPVVNPILTHFCVELTGILQEMVDNEKTFPEVLELFNEWREEENINESNSLYVTSGDWDLGLMLPRQCKLNNIAVPRHMMEWIDVKKLYANNSTHYCSSLIQIINALGLQFEGRIHSGIDDCINIFNVIKKLLQSGVELAPTSKLTRPNY